MAMAFLSEENCNLAENANNALTEIPKRLRACSTAYRNGINNQNISPMLENSDKNKSTRDNLLKYCDSMDEMAFTLERLHQTIASLVLNSRRAIRTGCMEENHE